jgi:hypothetical protein
MPLFLKSGEDIVAELAPAITPPEADQCSWPLRPTNAFARVQPTVDAMVAAISNPQVDFQTEVYQRLMELDLRVVDETGAVMPFTTVTILGLPKVDLAAAERERFEEAGFVGPPFYVVGGRRDAPGTVSGTT